MKRYFLFLLSGAAGLAFPGCVSDISHRPSAANSRGEIPIERPDSSGETHGEATVWMGSSAH